MLPYPPLGIAVLAGYLKRNGIPVQIDDLEMKYWGRDIIEFEPIKQLLRGSVLLKYNNPKKIFLDSEKVSNYIDADKCHFAIKKILNEWELCLNVPIDKFTHIGLSIMSLGQLATSLCFAKYIKQKYGTKIILGGSFITGKTSVIMERYKFIDYMIIGEGEIPLSRLLLGEPVEMIASLIFRKAEQIVSNTINTDYPDNMEPNFEGLPFELYRQNKLLLIPYETSKGCVNKCSFCITRRKRLHFKDASQIVREIENIKERHNTVNFIFVDNAINIDNDFSVELCKHFITNKLGILWSAYCIPKDDDSEYFQLLRAAGCIQLRWGVETGGDSGFRIMNKQINPSEISRSICKSSCAGIWNHLIFTVGHPGEKMDDIFRTISFIRKNKLYFSSAIVAPFDLARVDMIDEDSDIRYQHHYSNGEISKKNEFGLTYRIFKDRHSKLKYNLLITALRYSGIRFIGNFSKRKQDFNKDQFIYGAFEKYIG